MSRSPDLVWLLMLGVAVVGSNSLALSPILSDVAADLGATPVAVARANAAYGGATALSALCLGGLVDRYGPEKLLVGGLAGLALAMLASAGATQVEWLALAQGAAGALAGVILPATYALATAIAPEGRGAETLGRVLTGWSLSLVAGVPASAYVAGAFSWRASYLGFAALLLIASILLARQPLRVEIRSSGARTHEVLRRPEVLPLLLVCLLFMTAFYGVYAYLGDHVRRHLGLSASEAGRVVLAYGIGFGLGACADRAVDRIGATRPFPWVLATVALVYAAMSPALATVPTILLLSAAWGFANHFGLNIIVLRLTRAAPEARGSVLALNSATSYAGALLGAWFFGILYEGLGFGSVTAAATVCAGLAALIAFLPAPARPSRQAPSADAAG
ncbi:MAG TPA: MFS transporter [Beijerinckiaceae bacterium]|jgi:predicted MFS family arabinose efflux permease